MILLDVQIAGMDGFETASLIRTRVRSHATPIIFLTAYDPTGARTRRGYRLGATDYILKPFDPYILRSKVSIFVELFRKTVALEQATAEIAVREQQVVALNGELEDQVIRRTVALAAANIQLDMLWRSGRRATATCSSLFPKASNPARRGSPERELIPGLH